MTGVVQPGVLSTTTPLAVLSVTWLLPPPETAGDKRVGDIIRRSAGKQTDPDWNPIRHALLFTESFGSFTLGSADKRLTSLPI